MNKIKFLCRLLSIAAALMFFSINIFALDNSLRGVVIDSETNKSIPLVTVEIIELNKTTISSDSGYFSFQNISDGTYTLKFLHLSYKEKLQKINFTTSENKIIVVSLQPKAIEISTVTVTDFDEIKSYEDLLTLSNTLKNKELTKELSLTLASTLKNETGVSLRSMGSAPSRPVIRGLGSDRIVISEDGNKTTDLSATSPDHAVTIDPFTSEKIEIIRGPRVLTKSLTTIGGLVNVIKHEIPIQIHDEIFGTAGTIFESVNNSFLSSLQTEIPFSPFTSRIEISKSKAGNQNTADGELKNSSSENLNLSAGFSFINDDNVIGASVRQYSLEYGIPGGFIGAHPYGANIKLFREQANALGRFTINDFFYDTFEINLSLVKYRHQEFEHSGRIGAEFRIINNLARFELSHKTKGSLQSGLLGFSFDRRDFNVGGFVFTSPSIAYNYSFYSLETVNLDKFIIEMAARFSFDLIQPYEEKLNSKIGDIKERRFSNYSAAISFVYPLTKIVHVGLNLSKSSRVPTIEELYSEGPHLAAYSYEVGNPKLKSESGWSSEIFVYHKFTKLYYNFNFFYYSLNNFIIPRNSGKINYSTFLPIYVTSSVPAKLYGIEFQTEWNFIGNFYFKNSFSYNHGEFSNTSKPLPQIPPAKGFVSIELKEDSFSAGLTSEFAFSQNRVDEFEQRTDGYIIFGAFAQYNFEAFKNINLITLNLENITNQVYRNHLSRIKVILPEAGFNVRLIYKFFFHI